MATSRKRQGKSGVSRGRGRGRVSKIRTDSPKGKRISQIGIKRFLINKDKDTGPTIGVLVGQLLVDLYNPQLGTVRVEVGKPYRKEGKGRVFGLLSRW